MLAWLPFIRVKTSKVPPRAHGSKGFLVMIVVTLLLIAPSACGPTRTIGGADGIVSTSSKPLVVRGDWDDIPAAVAAAINNQEIAIVSRTAEPNRWTFTLLTIRDEPGLLVATAQDGAIVLTCRLGHFGDADRERQLLERMGRRLSELAGVGAFPLRW